MKVPLHMHVVGAAGVGMSAVAQALRDAGFEVTGSDRFLDGGRPLPVLACLEKAGVRLVPQDGSGIDAATAAVVVSTAIEDDNPDLAAARKFNVPVVHRAEMIARLAEGKRLVAVTGTAGKTTVTALIGFICAEAGLDPVVVNGGAAVDWQADDRVGNVRRGASDLWIIEADESDKSLMHFHPDCVVITNVSKDHFELDEVITLFRGFRERAKAWCILGPQAAQVLDGMKRSNRWNHEALPFPMIGKHNEENTRLAAEVCMKLGVSPEDIRRALEKFRGVHRRLEIVSEKSGVTVIDDYAHNPAKIAASWSAVAEKAERVLGIWRPHGFAPLSLMFDEFVDAFSRVCRDADRLYILPVFFAGGTVTETDDAERLAAELKQRGVNARYVGGYGSLAAELRPILKAGDTVLGMGARDPDLPEFLRSLN